MTDRIRTVIVALDRDYRDDDAQAILDAIRMVRGVAAVGAEIVDVEAWVSRQQVASEWRSTLIDVACALADGRTVSVEPKP